MFRTLLSMHGGWGRVSIYDPILLPCAHFHGDALRTGVLLNARLLGSPVDKLASKIHLLEFFFQLRPGTAKGPEKVY